MSDAADGRWEQLARRYNLANDPEWQKLLTHFDLSEEFGLVILLVVDSDGAALCRHELQEQLRREEKQLIALELPTPADLQELPTRLLATKPGVNDACLWVEAVAPDYSKTYSEWRAAWQTALARLNAHRNPIRQQFDLSLVFVGAPWLQQVMREIAPDLWSVLTLVARVNPLPQTEARAQAAAASPAELTERSGGDPLFALGEAEKLRGVPGKELALARLLHRAGEGFAGRDDWRSAEKAFTEALELKQHAGAPEASLMSTLNQLAIACQITGQARRAIPYLEQALRISREIGDRRGEGNALWNSSDEFWKLGNRSEAIARAEAALRIFEAIEDPAAAQVRAALAEWRAS